MTFNLVTVPIPGDAFEGYCYQNISGGGNVSFRQEGCYSRSSGYCYDNISCNFANDGCPLRSMTGLDVGSCCTPFDNLDTTYCPSKETKELCDDGTSNCLWRAARNRCSVNPCRVDSMADCLGTDGCSVLHFRNGTEQCFPKSYPAPFPLTQCSSHQNFEGCSVDTGLGCVWVKTTAKDTTVAEGRCVAQSSTVECELYYGQTECGTSTAAKECIWNVLGEIGMCVNKSAVTACNTLSSTNCGSFKVNNKVCKVGKEGVCEEKGRGSVATVIVVVVVVVVALVAGVGVVLFLIIWQKKKAQGNQHVLADGKNLHAEDNSELPEWMVKSKRRDGEGEHISCGKDKNEELNKKRKAEEEEEKEKEEQKLEKDADRVSIRTLPSAPPRPLSPERERAMKEEMERQVEERVQRIKDQMQQQQQIGAPQEDAAVRARMDDAEAINRRLAEHNIDEVITAYDLEDKFRVDTAQSVEEDR